MKSMVFIDYQNFNISIKNYFSSINEKPFNVNFSTLAKELNNRLPMNPTLMKTYLFAYKPCDELLKLESYREYYKWLSGIKNKPFFEIIEGSQEIRSLPGDVQIDINDPNTYTTREKGTDIQLAVNMLSKGYQNAYDVGILVSGDTDYIPVIEELHHLGKIVILATFPTQNTSKYDEHRDFHIKMNLPFLKSCIPQERQHTNPDKT